MIASNPEITSEFHKNDFNKCLQRIHYSLKSQPSPDSVSNYWFQYLHSANGFLINGVCS